MGEVGATTSKSFGSAVCTVPTFTSNRRTGIANAFASRETEALELQMFRAASCYADISPYAEPSSSASSSVRIKLLTVLEWACVTYCILHLFSY